MKFELGCLFIKYVDQKPFYLDASWIACNGDALSVLYPEFCIFQRLVLRAFIVSSNLCGPSHQILNNAYPC